jgi:Dolichyl-phosphate-mannose-protein mannosyltransferase
MPNHFRRLFLLLILVSLVFVFLTFQQYGASNDELVQQVYGEKLYSFYRSSFQDLSAFSYKNLYLYGGLFDLLASVIEKLIPLSIWDVRHLLSALFGILGLVAVYKTANYLSGPRAGFLAALMLALTGAWMGAMFTHTKDVTFGATMAWALYYMTLSANRFPKLPWRYGLLLGLMTGLSLGLRIGGVFCILYVMLLILGCAILNRSTLAERAHFILQSLIRLLPGAGVALLVMGIFWPWVMMGWDHFLIAAKSFSYFAFDMNTIADGQWVKIGDISRFYFFEYLLVRLPEIFLGALFISIYLLIKQFKGIKAGFKFYLSNHLPLLSLAIATLFPMLFILYDRPALYNGIRHFTFTLAPLAIVAGIGLSNFWEMLSSKRAKVVVMLIGLTLVTEVLYRLVMLHPYEYVYYNHFAAPSMKQAEHLWEGDYWSEGIKEASTKLEDYITQETKQNPSETKGPYLVAICAENFQGKAYLDDRFVVSEDWVNADFYISSTNMNCDQVLKGKVIATINRLGATLGVVKDRRDLVGNDRLPHAPPRN